MPLRRVASGEPLFVRELLNAEQMQFTEIVLHAAWQLEPHELVMGYEEVNVDPEKVVRPILVVP